MNNLIKIKDISTKYDITARTLRYYEDKGLITSTRCDDYSYRMYDEDAVRRIEQILILRKLNISIKDIQRIFSTSSSNIVLEVLEKKVQNIDDEVALLHELKDIVLDFIHEIEKVNFSDNSDVKLLYDKAKDIETQLVNVDYIGKPSNVNRMFDVTEKLKKEPDVRIIQMSPFKAVTTGPVSLFGTISEFMDLVNNYRHLFMDSIFGDIEFVWVDCPNNFAFCPTCGENCQMKGQFNFAVKDNVTAGDVAPYELLDFKGGMYAVASSIDQDEIIVRTSGGVDKWLETSGFERDDQSGRREMTSMIKITPEVRESLGYEQQNVYIPVKPRKKLSDEIITDSTSEKYEFSSPVWWAAFSKYYQVSGDFELTFKLNVKGGDAAFNSYSTAYANSRRYSEGYFETALVRSDSFGWGAGDNKVYGGGDMIHEKDYETDEDFVSCMRDANVVHKITRRGNDFTSFATFKGKNGSTYTRKTTFTSEAPNDMLIFLAADGASITIENVTIK